MILRLLKIIAILILFMVTFFFLLVIAYRIDNQWSEEDFRLTSPEGQFDAIKVSSGFDPTTPTKTSIYIAPKGMPFDSGEVVFSAYRIDLSKIEWESETQLGIEYGEASVDEINRSITVNGNEITLCPVRNLCPCGPDIPYPECMRLRRRKYDCHPPNPESEEFCQRLRAKPAP